MEEEEVYGDVEVPATRWHWTFVVIQLLGLAANIAGAFRTFFGSVAQDVASYANHQLERDEFEADAGRELESLIEGPEED